MIVTKIKTGNPEGVPAPSREGLRWAEPSSVHAIGVRRGIGVWAFVLALVTAGALAHVAIRMRGIQIAYDLGRARRANVELEERRRSLTIEIGMLKDPGRVIGVAHDQLHMGPPAPADMVKLAPGVVLP